MELILALDLPDAEKAIALAERVSKSVDYIKVNYPLILSAGIEIVEILSEIKPVIADLKIADIPYTSSIIAEKAFEHKARAVISHGFCGADVVKAVLDVAESYGGEVYVVTELSNPGAVEFMSQHSERIARMAEELGCHGLIAPATRIDRLKKIRGVSSLKIYSPGVGFQGGSVEVARYVDGVIVGRSICLSEHPEKTARELKMKLLELAGEKDVRDDCL